MNDQFDELTKSLAQSVTRRGALKKFGLSIAATVLASLGLVTKAEAGKETPCFDACMATCGQGGVGSKNGCKHYCLRFCGGGGR